MEPTKSDEQPAVVSRDNLESLIREVECKIAEPNAGIFGPQSISWRIDRESALFLGAGRAALLQLAHPWVAVALTEHSSLLNDPIARFHNTFRVVFTLVFGSAEQAIAAARGLHETHRHIRGKMPETVAGYSRSSTYEANHIPALRWVFATLIESAVLAHDCVLAPLTKSECNGYYAESKMLASLFGIPGPELPANWDALLAYIREMSDSNALGVNERSRAMGQKLLAGAGSWVRPPHWYRALTTEWMPPRFREEFRLAFGTKEHGSVRATRRRLPKLYRRLPAAARFVGPYHEARARLEHQDASPVVLASNRFWIGQTRMPFVN